MFNLLGRNSCDSAKKKINGRSYQWSVVDDLDQLGLLDEEGVILGKNPSGKGLLKNYGPEHIAVIGPTRSGKGIGVVIPTLLTWQHSVVVTDIQGENWNITSGYRQKHLNNRVLKFDPTAQDGSSVRYNPLAEIRRGTKNEMRDVQNIADMLVDPDGEGQKGHWAKTGYALLVGVITHLIYVFHKEDRGIPTMYDIASYLSRSDTSFDELLEKMKKFPHPKVAEAAAELQNKSENEKSGVLSTAMSFLALYRDPVIAANTSASDFCVEDLMNEKKPISLYLVIPPCQITRLKPLIRLMLNLVLDRSVDSEKLEKGEQCIEQRMQRLLFLIDEFPAFGSTKSMETVLTHAGNYGIKALLVMQSISQIHRVYEGHSSILDNCHIQIYFTPNDPVTQKFIAEKVGMPEMIASYLPYDKEIISIYGHPPILGNKLFYYKEKFFNERTKYALAKSDIC